MNRKLSTSELNRPQAEEYKEIEKIPVIVILDNIRSLSNVGSVFRTGDAFLVEKIILCGITGRPPHREIQRTALGATESVAWEYIAETEEAIKQCKMHGYTAISVEQTSKSIGPEALSSYDKLCLIFGNEVDGVSDQAIALSDTSVEIPQSGTKHSLNISVAAGVILWEVYRMRSSR